MKAARIQMKQKVYKLGWKVVGFNADEKMVSHAYWFVSTVEYKFSKSTFPNDGSGPLCVFTNKLDALHFKMKMATCTERLARSYVFPCAYIPSKSKHVWRITSEGSCVKVNIAGFFKGKALASEVILLKEGGKKRV